MSPGEYGKHPALLGGRCSGAVADEEERQDDRALRGVKPGGRRLIDLLLVLFLSLVFMFGVVRPFVVEPFGIPSGSMTPTLQPGDRVLVVKFAYRFTDPDQGDLVAFEDIEDGGEVNIKRVVGLPGDTIEVWDGVLIVNGEAQEEPYVDYRLTDSTFFGPESVPENEVFVLGDNRTNSRDSRIFGPIAEEELTGKVLLRFWPPERIGSLAESWQEEQI